MTFLDNCTDDADDDLYPNDPPPCSENTCSIIWRTLRESGGKLAATVRLRGGQSRIDADPEDDCGVLACFTDSDGNFQGLDVDIFGDPEKLTNLCDTVDYVNPLRRIENSDGSCSLGTLPFPIQDQVCAESSPCEQVLASEGAEDAVFNGCQQQVCVTIENPSCYPMIVTPRATTDGGAIQADAPASFRLLPNLNGSFITNRVIFSAGSGNDDTLDVQHSSTLEFPPTEIAAGGTYTFCVTPQIKYDAEVTDPFRVQWPTLRVCVLGVSKVNAETIAALETTT